MESNSARRPLKLNTLVVGVLGIVVGVLAMALSPSLLAQPPKPVNQHNPNAVTVTLHFKRGANMTLELQGCTAKELNGNDRGCDAGKPITKPWTAQVNIEWNGQDGGSGCSTVGGVRYCW